MRTPVPETLRGVETDRRRDNPPETRIAADGLDPAPAGTGRSLAGSTLGRTHRQHLSALALLATGRGMPKTAPSADRTRPATALTGSKKTISDRAVTRHGTEVHTWPVAGDRPCYVNAEHPDMRHARTGIETISAQSGGSARGVVRTCLLGRSLKKCCRVAAVGSACLMSDLPGQGDLSGAPVVCPLCGQVHQRCRFSAGSLYCIRADCRNPHHRWPPPASAIGPTERTLPWPRDPK